jgi:hypothetical protein
MLAYYISGSNYYTFRTLPTSSANLILQLEDMLTLVNTSASISASGRPYTYDAYESKLNWTAYLVSASVGDQYRAYITDGTSSIWHGSISVFAPQTVEKFEYEAQLGVEERYISNLTENEYIIMD